MDSPAENKELVRRFFAEIDAGNLAAMDELVAEDYTDHRPPSFPGLPQGREGLKLTFAIFWGSTPVTHQVLDQLAVGDLVITRMRVRSLVVEVDVDVTAVAVHRIRDGVLAERLGEPESLQLTRRLGLRTAV